MKFLLPYFFTRHNKGDAAIVNVMIDQILRIYPNAEIIISSMDRTTSSSTFHGHPETSSMFYQAIYVHANPVIRIVRSIVLLSNLMLWSVLYVLIKHKANIFLLFNLRNIVEEYGKADYIIGVGGGYLHGNNSIRHTISTLLQLMPVLIAKTHNKPMALYSQSIGPFRNKLQFYIAKNLLSRVDLIIAREDITMKNLRDLGLNFSKIKRSVDAGFLFRPHTKSIMRTFLKKRGVDFNKKVIGITVKSHFGKEKQIEYENAFIQLMNFFKTKDDTQLLIIPQATSSLHRNDDRTAGRNIYNKLRDKNNVFLFGDMFDHQEIKGIYDNLDYLIATRMHSAIFALTGNIPTIAIAYEHKTEGIMKDIHLSEWVLPIQEVKGRILIEKFILLQKKRASYLKILKKYMPDYIKEAENTIYYIRDFIEKNEK